MMNILFAIDLCEIQKKNISYDNERFLLFEFLTEEKKTFFFLNQITE